MSELERAAQKAAEERLAYCCSTLDGEEDLLEADDPRAPCAPFCGCDTCIVREVLDAAWPHLMEVARLEAAANV